MVNGEWKQLACHRTRGWKTRESRGASAAGCGASARTGGRDTLRGTAMPRRGRPAQGHAPAEGLAQNDTAAPVRCPMRSAEPRLWGRREMVVEWLVNRP